jgi:hypothetical protein
MELRAAGFTALEIYNHAKNKNHAIQEYINAGFPLKTLISIFPLSEFKRNGFSFADLRKLGIENDDDLYEAGYIQDLELEALSLLYQATHGPFWKQKANWNNYDKQLCQWFGISTVFDPTLQHERVTGIDLVNNNLRGYLPAELCNLKKLGKFNLTLNNLSTNIPTKLKNFIVGNSISTDFIRLQLPSGISSPTPSSLLSSPVKSFPMSAPSNLDQRSLNFTDSRSIQPFSPSTRLVDNPSTPATTNHGGAIGAKNTFQSPTVPQSGNSVLSLQDHEAERAALVEFYHSLRGIRWKRADNWCSEEPLSKWYGIKVGKNGNVMEINLPSNNLHGVMPDSITTLQSLRVIDLRLNQIGGFLPQNLGDCRHLEKIHLQSNKLCGNVPERMRDLKQLKILDLRSNLLTGISPHLFLSINHLQYLGLHSNRFNPNDLKEIVNILPACKVIV